MEVDGPVGWVVFREVVSLIFDRRFHTSSEKGAFYCCHVSLLEGSRWVI